MGDKTKKPLRQHDISVGAKQERERIIALIERRRCSENEQTHNCMWLNDYQADDLIALIKGEN